MRFFRSIAAIILLVGMASPALALVVPPPPAGMCVVDASKPADRTILPALHLGTQTAATMQALFASCGELEQVRIGKTNYVSSYASLMEQATPLAAAPDAATALALISAAAGMSGSISSQASREDTTTTYQPSVQRVLKQTPTLLIIGSEQRHLVHRMPVAMAAITGITVMGGKLVTFNLYQPINTPLVVDEAGKAVEAYMNNLLAANP